MALHKGKREPRRVANSTWGQSVSLASLVVGVLAEDNERRPFAPQWTPGLSILGLESDKPLPCFTFCFPTIRVVTAFVTGEPPRLSKTSEIEIRSSKGVSPRGMGSKSQTWAGSPSRI